MDSIFIDGVIDNGFDTDFAEGFKDTHGPESECMDLRAMFFEQYGEEGEEEGR